MYFKKIFIKNAFVSACLLSKFTCTLLRAGNGFQLFFSTGSFKAVFLSNLIRQITHGLPYFPSLSNGTYIRAPFACPSSETCSWCRLSVIIFEDPVYPFVMCIGFILTSSYLCVFYFYSCKRLLYLLVLLQFISYWIIKYRLESKFKNQ